MRTYQLEKADQIHLFHQQPKSISATSFSRTAPRQPARQSSQLSHSIQSQQRQGKQQIDKLKQALQIKMEYMTKRSEQSIAQNNKIMKQLTNVEKQLGEAVKQTYKIDKTREWAIQLEKSIQGIFQSSKQIHMKGTEKQIQQCRKSLQIFQEYESKTRQEKKQRQRNWEQVIDNVGQTIIDAESVIQQEREQIQNKIAELQSLILDVQQSSFSALQAEKESRKQQHQYLAKLIQRIMAKLIC